ncbi:MAG: FIG004453: protein YceG like [uncultured Thermomicrobiales bacterium]|uniref:Endolytic murein transglycosylase n=1 Tax=uncultured Thermomicrobiales bacterium TaxID=1645740 RepID=A0A6J4VMT2_9BACT|nr:MAG: FIG004453: protein YceG like [uncultured Thermomicrobiales bacterium]
MLRMTVQSLKVVTIVAVALAAAVGGRVYWDYTRDRVADPNAGQPVPFTVSEEDDGDTLAARLRDEGLIRSEFYFANQLRLGGAQLRPGEYTLVRGMSVSQIIDRITDDGDAAEDDQANEQAGRAEEAVAEPRDVLVVPGSRLEQVAEAWGEAGLEGGAEAFIEATGADFSQQFPFLAERPEGTTLEGYLFPDTYTLGPDTAPEDAVLAMLQNFDQQVSQEMRDSAAAQGLSLHEVMTVASIVEREVQVASERPVVAAVYLNRIEQNMKLDADPTVSYVLGGPDEWWPVLQPDQQYSEEAQSPYNTYENDNLPPGPICNPSAASIAAVLERSDVEFLYFVAKNDGSGEHAFATTLEEQEQNIAFYLGGGAEGGAAPTETPAP